MTAQERLAALDFSVGLSIRYHGKRKRFFESLHHSCAALTVLFSSSTFAALISKPEISALAQTLSFGMAVASALDIVLDFSGKAVFYRDLKNRFTELAMRLNAPEAPERISELENERLSIERDEPDEYGALSVICHDEESMARGWPKTSRRLSWAERALAYVWPFSGVDFTSKTA